MCLIGDMKKISEQTNILKGLKKTSKTICKNMLPLMKEITDPNNDLSDEVAIRCKVSLEASTAKLQELCLDLVFESEVVVREIDKFADVLQESKSSLSNHLSNYPFLGSVWFGDVYDDKSEFEGLKELLKELQSSLKQANEDWLIETAVSNLTK